MVRRSSTCRRASCLMSDLVAPPAASCLLSLTMRADGLSCRSIGTRCNFDYSRLVMPPTASLASDAHSCFGYSCILTMAGQYASGPGTCFSIQSERNRSIPKLTAARGNWGSLVLFAAHHLSMCERALFDAGGVFPASLRCPLSWRWKASDRLCVRLHRLAITAVLLALVTLYGYIRLQQPVRGVETTFGLVSIDDPIGVRASASYTSNIFDEYDLESRSSPPRARKWWFCLRKSP